MFALFQLAGIFLIAYVLLVVIVNAIKKCSFEEAREAVASWWQENASGVPQSQYELSKDRNYEFAVNSTVENVMGETRYNELCKLARHSSALVFNDTHAGFPTVQITVNSNSRSEERRLQNILEKLTRDYVQNYRDSANVKVLSRWSKNPTLLLPMLVIMYSRNKHEKGMLDRIEQSDINKIVRRSVVRRGAFRG